LRLLQTDNTKALVMAHAKRFQHSGDMVVTSEQRVKNAKTFQTEAIATWSSKNDTIDKRTDAPFRGFLRVPHRRDQLVHAAERATLRLNTEQRKIEFWCSRNS
jgi:hypothetical protein